MNRTRTFMLMLTLTVLFVLVGGLIGGRQGAVIAFGFAAGLSHSTAKSQCVRNGTQS